MNKYEYKDLCEMRDLNSKLDYYSEFEYIKQSYSQRVPDPSTFGLGEFGKIRPLKYYTAFTNDENLIRERGFAKEYIENIRNKLTKVSMGVVVLFFISVLAAATSYIEIKNANATMYAMIPGLAFLSVTSIFLFKEIITLPFRKKAFEAELKRVNAYLRELSDRSNRDNVAAVLRRSQTDKPIILNRLNQFYNKYGFPEKMRNRENVYALIFYSKDKKYINLSLTELIVALDRDLLVRKHVSDIDYAAKQLSKYIHGRYGPYYEEQRRNHHDRVVGRYRAFSKFMQKYVSEAAKYSGRSHSDSYSSKTSENGGSRDNVSTSSSRDNSYHTGFVDSSNVWRNPGEGYVDSAGIWRNPGEPFIDSSGYVRWPDSGFVDAGGIWRNAGDSFEDYSGNMRY